MKRCVYADHAATTPLMPNALEAMLPFMKGDFGNPKGVIRISLGAENALEDVRRIVDAMR